MAQNLLDTANHTFKAHNAYIQIVQPGEMQVLASAQLLDAKAVVIDERTTRMLVEQPEQLGNLMRSKLHTPIFTDYEKLNKLKKLLYGIKVIRSVELATLAYEYKILNKYIVPSERKTYRGLNRELLDSVLWGLKLRGCSVSQSEINTILKSEKY